MFEFALAANKYSVGARAGVAGLTTALVLARHADYEITILAQYIPGDEAPHYTSPWAGANFLPYGLSAFQLPKVCASN